MTSAEATFHIGDTVVYAMQGIGRIKDITTRTTEGRQRDFYHIELGKTRVKCWYLAKTPLPLAYAMRCRPRRSRRCFSGCSEQPHGQCCGDRVNSIICGVSSAYGRDRRQVWRRCDASCMNSNRSRVSLTSVYVSSAPMYTPSCPEIAQALGCSLATAEHLVNTALTSTHPVALPRP